MATPAESKTGPGSVPLTARGRRTRAALLTAARAVFERDGYLDAKVTEIARDAHVSVGTFYTYFATKEDLFREIAFQVQDEMLATAPDPRVALHTPLEVIEHANRAYLQAYQRNASIMRILEEVSALTDEFRELRLIRLTAFTTRIEQAIKRLQRAGVADRTLDAHYTANALAAMVSRYAYCWFVFDLDFDFDRSVRTLTQLWANALRLDSTPASAGAAVKRGSAVTSARSSRRGTARA